MEQKVIVCDDIDVTIKYPRFQPYHAFVKRGCEMRRDQNKQDGGRCLEANQVECSIRKA